MEKNKKKIIMIYGRDIDDNGVCGPETMMRIRVAVDKIQKSTDDFIVLLAAGYPSKKKPWMTLKSAMQGVLLHELGKLGFVPRGNTLSDGKQSIEFIISPDQAWGTDPETRAALKALYLHDPNLTDVTVVSSNYHLSRINMIWGFFPQYKVTVVGCNYHHPERFLEPLKYVKDYIRELFNRFWTKRVLMN